MRIMNAGRLPKPQGHYSTAIISNHFLFVSGQLPISAEGSHHHEDDFETQFNILFQNLEQVLTAASCSFSKVVKVTAYLSDIKYSPQFNALFADFIGKHKPVRTVVPVTELPWNYKLEVDLIAGV